MKRICSIGKLSVVVMMGLMLGFVENARSEVPEFTPQDIPLKNGREKSIPPADSVDPWSGNLKVHYVDLRIPGTAGMDIEVHRNYSLQKLTAGLAAPHKQSSEWTALGPGWTVAAAPRIYHSNRYRFSEAGTPTYFNNSTMQFCNNQIEAPPYRLRLQLPDGSNEAFYRVAPYENRTKSNWRLSCQAMVLTLTSPTGVVYDMGNAESDMRFSASQTSFFVEDPDATESFFLAKKATDLFGNWISYEYVQYGPQLVVPINGTVYIDHCIQMASPSGILCEKSDMLLSRITSSDGRFVQLDYDPATGRLISLSDNSNRITKYEYTAEDALNSRALARVVGPTGDTWTYTYQPGEFFQIEVSDNSYATDERAASRKLITIEEPGGGKTSYNYSYTDVTRRLSGHLYWRRFERVSRKINPDGAQWSYSYTRGETGQYDVTAITGPEGVTTHEFIGAGYNISSDNSPANNTLWSVGNPVKVTQPDGSYETFKWQQRTFAEGIDYIFDVGMVNDEAVWASDLSEHSYVRDGATYTTQYANYDAYGNPGTRTEIGPNGGSRTTSLTWYNDPSKWIVGLPGDEAFPGSAVSRSYDSNGKLISYTRNGVANNYTYDAQGNRATHTRPGDRQYSYTNYKLGIPQTEVQPEGITLYRVVDDAGNISSEIDGEGQTTQYTHDGLNRVTSVTPAVGSVRSISYTPTSKTDVRGTFSEITQYDLFGRIASVNRAGIINTRTYDALGRIAFRSDPNSSSGTSYQYDVLGRTVKVTNADGTTQTIVYGPASRTLTDERGKATTYTYRGYGNAEKLSLMAISSPDPAASVVINRDTLDQITSVAQGGFTRTYSYNANGYLTSVNNPETGDTIYGRDIAGNMLSRQTGASGVTTFTYDGQNRQVAINYPAGTPSVKKTYSKTGKLLVASSGGGIRSFAYNAVGSVIQERLSIDGKLFKLSYSYDTNDRLRSVTYSPSGRVIEYNPDVLGRPTSVSGYVNKATYWPNGMIKRINYANGTITSFGQTSRLWPSFFTTETTAGAEYVKSVYSYDGVGNLLTVNDFVDNNMDRTLAYDDINRLVGANGFWGSGTVAYDGVGNLTQQTFGGTSLTYSYDTQNRLASVGGQRVANIGYDIYGNVSSSGGNSYFYDDVPNLVCVNCQNASNKVEYQYDGLNQRSSVSYASSKVYEMQDSDGKLRMELDGDTLTEYFYLGDQRIAQQVSP